MERSQYYGYEQEYEKKVKWLEKDKRITAANKQAIQQYIKDKLAEGITLARASILITTLSRVSRHTKKSLKDFTEADLRQLIAELEGNSKFGVWTKNTTKAVLKNFFRHYNKPTEMFSWMKSIRPASTIRSEDLLTDNEMNRMVAAASNPMWKALLGVLFDTGTRPRELLSPKIKDVMRNGSKYKLYVTGKTEKVTGARTVYVYKALPLLEAWLKLHPQKNNPEALLWTTEEGQPVQTQTLNVLYKKISRRAKITRRNWPYLVRHTKLTEFYREHGAIIGAKLAGHVVGSKEARTYLHLSESDIETALDASNGVTEQLKPVELQKCSKCNSNNSYGEIFCQSCQAALGSAGALLHEEEHAQDMEELEQLKELLADPQLVAALKALKNPEVLDVIKNAIKQPEKLRSV